MPIHDVQCSKCGTIIENYFKSPWPSPLLHDDGGELDILWRATTFRDASAHPLDRTVVWRNPATGQISYPGRNDEAMPDRYTKLGFERVEFEHARDLEKFEKSQGVINEKLWYNSGNEAPS
jgi:hypothetical protein